MSSSGWTCELSILDGWSNSSLLGGGGGVGDHSNICQSNWIESFQRHHRLNWSPPDIIYRSILFFLRAVTQYLKFEAVPVNIAVFDPLNTSLWMELIWLDSWIWRFLPSRMSYFLYFLYMGLREKNIHLPLTCCYGCFF